MSTINLILYSAQDSDSSQESDGLPHNPQFIVEQVNFIDSIERDKNGFPKEKCYPHLQIVVFQAKLEIMERKQRRLTRKQRNARRKGPKPDTQPTKESAADKAQRKVSRDAATAGKKTTEVLIFSSLVRN